jgi:Holliday junction resolvase RusA-like endonuclease
VKIKVTILVDPTPRAKPLHAVSGGKVIAYTPEKTRVAKIRIETRIQDALLEKGIWFSEGMPIRMEATFYRLKPKSTSKRVKLPATKPDWDNYAGLLTDALEKYVYYNDSQITTAVIRKRFGSPPRIELMLNDDNEVPDWF